MDFGFSLNEHRYGTTLSEVRKKEIQLFSLSKTRIKNKLFNSKNKVTFFNVFYPLETHSQKHQLMVTIYFNYNR